MGLAGASDLGVGLVTRLTMALLMKRTIACSSAVRYFRECPGVVFQIPFATTRLF